MTDNWWRSLLDSGDRSDRDDGDEALRSGRRRPVGRIEDPRRQVDVRMLSVYPRVQKMKRSNNEKPAGVSDRDENRSVYRPIEDNKSRPVDGGDAKKKPFRPTHVPSPVYGFKQPPEGFYRNGEKQLYLDPKKEEREKKQIDRMKSGSRERRRPDALQSTGRSGIEDRIIQEPAINRQREGRPAAGRSDVHSDDPAGDADGRGFYDRAAGGRENVVRDEPATGGPSVETHLRPDGEQALRRSGQNERSGPVGGSGEKQERSGSGRLSAGGTARATATSHVPYNVLMFHADRHPRAAKPADRARNEKSEPRRSSDPDDGGDLRLPLSLLDRPPEEERADLGLIEEKQRLLAKTLDNFHVQADIVGHVRGPSVTRFDIRLHPGVKMNKLLSLSEDLKLRLAVRQIRIAAVPGTSSVGIEVPNVRPRPVLLRQILDSQPFRETRAPLAAALGCDVSGRSVVTDLSKMPHGLIAGATGSGKSVCIHSIIISLIYRTPPKRLRLLLIDPKVVELAAYRRLPHLAAPVITEPREAALSLKWAVEEMERRYRTFAEAGVRDIDGYNDRQAGSDRNADELPYLVIIIDELADLMMASPADVEEAICRIAQKARAAGIHLLVATQRPSVDVITGLIKSNIPTRIAFSVSSQADSRTIIDSGGAEKLLGRGDMLFAENGARTLRRLQGCFVSDKEIRRVTEQVADAPLPDYLFDVDRFKPADSDAEEEDDLIRDAAAYVVEQGQASVSSIQRHFRVGYNRAARLIDALEARHVVSGANGSKPRQVLATRESLEEQ